MTELVALQSLLFAGECFFGASLILGFAWLAARNGTASRRHLIWLGAFGAMLMLPVLAVLVPPQVVFHLPAEPAPVLTDLPAVAAPAPTGPSFGVSDVVTALVVLWLAGVAAVAGKTLVGIAGLVRLYHRSVPHIPHGIDGARFAGASWQLRLRTAPGDEGPVTWGVVKSIVLLPKASVRWPRQRLEAVLLHEFAHVRRRDSLARLIALLACAFYWPNPFVWTAAARMRREAEIAADDAVLSSGVRASSYAEELVMLAREFGRDHASFAGVTLAMAEPSSLDERVQSVLSPVQSRSGVTKMDVLKIAALGAAVTAGLVLARPSLAEAKDVTTINATAEVEADKDDPHVKHVVVHATDGKGAPKHVTVQTVVNDDDPNAVTVQVSDAEPPEPPAPPASVAPPAPPAPPAHVAPPAPPAPPAALSHRHLSAEDRADLERAMAEQREQMRQAQAAMRQARAEMRKAIADAHIDEKVAEAMRQAQPALAQAQKISQAEIKRAIAQAKISEAVAKAMEEARPQIEKALAEAHRAAAEARRHAEDKDEDSED